MKDLSVGIYEIEDTVGKIENCCLRVERGISDFTSGAFLHGSMRRV